MSTNLALAPRPDDPAPHPQGLAAPASGKSAGSGPGRWISLRVIVPLAAIAIFGRRR